MHSLASVTWRKGCHGRRKVPYACKFLTASLSLRAGWQTGVAISFLRWGFPRQCDHWLGMTAFFNLMTLPDGRRSFVYEFYDTGAVKSLQDHKLHIKGGGQQRCDQKHRQLPKPNRKQNRHKAQDGDRFMHQLRLAHGLGDLLPGALSRASLPYCGSFARDQRVFLEIRGNL